MSNNNTAIAKTATVEKKIVNYVSKTFWDIPRETRIQNLNNLRTTDLKASLPHEVWNDIISVYLNVGLESPEARRVFDWICENSKISPAVAGRPSDAGPFQYIYRFDPPKTPLDEYYVRSSSATAIHLRMVALEDNLPGIIRREIERQKLGTDEKFIILDVGAGPGDAIRKALRKEHHRDLADRCIVHCVDPDKKSIELGQKLVDKDGLSDSFRFHTMTMSEYSKKNGLAGAHLILVIGLLCPAKSVDCIKILFDLGWHSRPEGIVIYSTVQEEMIKGDPLLDVFMRILGWFMNFKTEEEAIRIGVEAGWIPEDAFWDLLGYNRMTIARMP